MKKYSIKNRDKVLGVLLTLGLSFVVADYASANWVTHVFGSMMQGIIYMLGQLLIMLMAALVKIAGYSHFIDSQAVEKGWVVVRDISNMFFVAVMLVIAFSTVLGIEKYNYRKALPKLIMMAVLINFSKTICGLLIDVAQVVMLTFVNAFKDMAGYNLVSMLGIESWQDLKEGDSSSIEWMILGVYFLAVIYAIISIVVIAAMIMMLVMRIVMIWIYVVLSPLAYLTAAFPEGERYSQQWWSEFTKNLIAGPVLAFFIWLSFATVTTDAGTVSTETGASDITYGNETGVAVDSNEQTAKESASGELLIKFMISIGMLLGGLKITQSIGGSAGSIAGGAMAKLQKGSSWAQNKAKKFATDKGKAAARVGKESAIGLAGGSLVAIGKGMEKRANDRGKTSKSGKAIRDLGSLGVQWREDMIKKDKKDKVAARKKYLEKIGMGEKAMDLTSQYLDTPQGDNVRATAGGIGGTAQGALLGGTVGSLLGPAGTAVGTIAGGTMGALFSGVARSKSLMAKLPKGKKWKWLQGIKRAEVTKTAAELGSGAIKNSRKTVHALASRPDYFETRTTGNTFYSNGFPDSNKNLFEQLASNDNAESPVALDNIKQNIQSMLRAGKFSGAGSKVKANRDKLQALLEGIAARDVSGKDVSKFDDIKSAILDVKAQTTFLPNDNYDTIKDTVVVNRKTGKEGQKGSGGLAVDTFAKNVGNKTEGNNMVFVDYDKMKQRGVNLDGIAEGSTIPQGMMKQVADALVQEIEDEKIDLEIQKEADTISSGDYNAKMASLNQAKDRITNQDFDNMALVNTSSRNFGRTEKLASTYHEQTHIAGLEDEELAEGTAQSLVQNRLYGKNKETKQRHSVEMGKMAKDMKDKGMSNAEILAKIDEEIKARVAGEAKSHEERVAKWEKGGDSAKADIGESGDDSPADNSRLAASIEDLNKKIENFGKESSGSLKVGLANATKMSLTPEASNFFYKMFSTLKGAVLKQGNTLGKHLDSFSKPLEAMAVTETSAEGFLPNLEIKPEK